MVIATLVNSGTDLAYCYFLMLVIVQMRYLVFTEIKIEKDLRKIVKFMKNLSFFFNRVFVYKLWQLFTYYNVVIV